jgi:hypothetical protein
MRTKTHGHIFKLNNTYLAVSWALQHCASFSASQFKSTKSFDGYIRTFLEMFHDDIQGGVEGLSFFKNECV